MRIKSWLAAHKKIVAISGATLLFITLGTATYAVLNRPTNPQQMLNQAIVNSFKAPSAAHRVVLKMTSPHGFSMTINAVAGLSPDKNLIQAAVKIHTGLADFNATGELYMDESGEIYVKAGNMSAIASILEGMGGVDANALKELTGEIGDKWIRISRFDVTEAKEALAAWNCAYQYNRARVSPQDEGALLALLDKHKYVTVAKELPGETILGEPSRHFEVTTNYSSEAPLYTEAGKLESFERAATECDSPNLKAFTSQQAADTPQLFSTESTEVWISKNSGQIIRTLLKSSTDEYDMTLTAETVYKPLTLTEPTHYILFERVRELFAPGSLSESYQYEFDLDDGHSADDGHNH